MSPSILKEVQQKVAQLRKSSHIRRALEDGILAYVQKRIASGNPENLKHESWPPLFIFCSFRSITEIRHLDREIDRVLRYTVPPKHSGTLQFLDSTEGEVRSWVAGRFELFVKSTFLHLARMSIDLDYPMPSVPTANVKLPIGSWQP